MKLFTFDLETTGTDVREDRIVQIAFDLRDTDDFDFPDVQKTRLVNPGIPIPQEASEVHGIYDHDVANEPSFQQIARSLLEYIGGAETALCGFNCRRFDVPLLRNELRRVGLDLELEGRPVVDTMTLYHRANPRKLENAVAQYIGESVAAHFREKAHDALADVQATRDVLFFMADLEDEYRNKGLAELHAICDETHRMALCDWDEWFGFEEPWVFQFGKHKGKELLKAPRSYTDWMLDKVGDYEFKERLRGVLNGGLGL